jgi:4-nitrophenyl phosphatase
MLEKLAKTIQGFIFDMDGVLWRADQPLGDLPAIFSRLTNCGFQYTFATNNGTRTPGQYQQRLQKFGIQTSPDRIITSAVAVTELLVKQFTSGGGVYVVGEEGIHEALQYRGFFPSEMNPLAVVAGMDRNFTFEKLRKANRFIRNGALFFGTNPDLTFPVPDGIEPGAGSILAAIQACTSVEPIIAGKPNPFLYELALQRMNLQPEQVIVVGDRLDTDILGAQKMNIKTCLVLSGVSSLADVEKWNPKPDWVVPNLESFILTDGN